MPKRMETFGDASENGAVLRVECPCGKTEYFMATDIVKVWGGKLKISSHRFKCQSCMPQPVTVTPLDIDLDRIPRGKVMRLHREGPAGTIEWISHRFRG